MINNSSVASYVGAWIETAAESAQMQPLDVASYVGAWIETLCFILLYHVLLGRILCGCVD